MKFTAIPCGVLMAFHVLAALSGNTEGIFGNLIGGLFASVFFIGLAYCLGASYGSFFDKSK